MKSFGLVAIVCLSFVGCVGNVESQGTSDRHEFLVTEGHVNENGSLTGLIDGVETTFKAVVDPSVAGISSAGDETCWVCVCEGARCACEQIACP